MNLKGRREKEVSKWSRELGKKKEKREFADWSFYSWFNLLLLNGLLHK